ncbi:MAG: hypothetical protein ACXWVK_08005 [Rhodoplanes sp.]
MFVCGPQDAGFLRTFDPLEEPGAKPKKPTQFESTGGAVLPPNYYEITDFDDIVV